MPTYSEMNRREHWGARHARHKSQQSLVRATFNQICSGCKIDLPCTVTLTRLSRRFLDDDNLRCAFKHIRDELAEILIPESKKYYMNSSGTVIPIKGTADSDARIMWIYEQEKHKKTGIRITIQHQRVHETEREA